MSTLLQDLEWYCMERMPASNDAAYTAQCERLDEMDKQIIQTMGQDFFTEYAKLHFAATQWRLTDHFRAGLRFGLQLAQEVLTP